MLELRLTPQEIAAHRKDFQKRAADQKDFQKRAAEIAERHQKAEEVKDEATGKWVAAALGWDKPGEEGMQAMFESLKSAAGSRGATFLGRPIKKDDTLQDVLKRIPAAELEEAGGTIKAIKMPETIQSYGSLNPIDLLGRILGPVGVDPFWRQPIAMVKFMRRKLQEYLDPEGKGPIEPRPPSTKLNYARTLELMLGENLSREDSPLVRTNHSAVFEW